MNLIIRRFSPLFIVCLFEIVALVETKETFSPFPSTLFYFKIYFYFYFFEYEKVQKINTAWSKAWMFNKVTREFSKNCLRCL